MPHLPKPADIWEPACGTRLIDLVIAYVRELDGILAGNKPGYRRSRRGPDGSMLPPPSIKLRMSAASHPVEAFAIVD